MHPPAVIDEGQPRSETLQVKMKRPTATLSSCSPTPTSLPWRL
jgi:hypothetical protein